MKRFLIIFIIILSVPITTYASNNESINYDEYQTHLEEYDLSAFDNALDENTISILENLGIDDFDVFNISSLTFNDFLNIVKNFALGKIQTPIKAGLEILVFILLSSFVQTFKGSVDNSLQTFYSSASSLIIVVILSAKISTSIAIASSTINVAANFIYAFLPTFFIIVTASGGVATSVSTNTLLLLLSQALSFISSTLFLPCINCFLGIGVCSSLSDELNLDKITFSFKKFITKAISILSASFVSILSIKTAVAAKADALGLRSMRFAINTVVPVIGSAISEGLLSIQSYSSLIKTSVGVVAIIAIAIIFLPSIIEVTVWRIVLSMCSSVSGVFNDKCVTNVITVFKDALLLINVVLILSMVTTIISFGILIVAKTG